jgi:membrane protein involved in D-alanine export
VIPYADFTYFGLLLYVVVPTVLLGSLGRRSRRWILFVTIAVLLVQYHERLRIGAQTEVREIWVLAVFAFWQWLVIRGYTALGAKPCSFFYVAVGASLLPLVLAKIVPGLLPQREIGFLGISYVTFRALDLVFCLRDRVIAAPTTAELFGFLFFFPTISAGPIDRYRRFSKDWHHRRTRDEFVSDLDGAVHRIFRGFLYKFILAALIKRYWIDLVAGDSTFPALLSYMYAYSFYLFFDFAGYSAFAIAISYLFGIHTPENFDRPFLARNIRDFWNRWHISLSFWFRDHVYMRFVLAATRGHWFANRHVLAVIGYFLAFGLMGLWHGIEWHFIVYGLYQAVLLTCFHFYSEWSKGRPKRPDTLLRRTIPVLVTFNLVCFGFLIFSGRLGR